MIYTLHRVSQGRGWTKWRPLYVVETLFHGWYLVYLITIIVINWGDDDPGSPVVILPYNSGAVHRSY